MRMPRWMLAGGLVTLLLVTAILPARAETMLKQLPGLDRVKSIAAAGDLYVALRANGSVWVWRDDATSIETAKPQPVTIACPVREMAPGSDKVALLCANGTVWTVDVAIDDEGVHRALQAPGLNSVKAVNMGRPGLVALRTDGSLWVAGFSISEPGVQRAEKVPDISDVTAVAAGIDDAVAIRADGTAWRLAINSKGTSVKRIAHIPPVRDVAVCGPDDDCDDTDPYLFVTADGKVLASALNTDGAEPVALGDLDGDGYLAAGHGRALSVTSTGDLHMAVLSSGGKAAITQIRSPGAPFKQVATGRRYDMGLSADGAVWMWEAPARLAQVPGLQSIKAIASGGDWHLALAADGKLYCWGSNDVRRTHVIPHVLEVRRITAAAGYYATLNTDGSIALGTCPSPGARPAAPIVHRDIAARYVAAGADHLLVITADGRGSEADIAIDEEGIHFSAFREVRGLEGTVQAAAGDDGYLVLRSDGTVWGARWGGSPAQVKGVEGAREISAGGNSYAVILGDGSVAGIAIDETGVHIWGDPHVDESDGIATSGDLGVVVIRADGTAAAFSRTVGAGQVSDILGGIAVAAGSTEHLVLMADGTVWRWPSSWR